jgi:hypothetical protein
VLVIPDRTGQQVLQPVRPAMPGRLGDRPAVVIVQLHKQPAHHLAAALPGLPAGKAPGHPPQQIRQQRGPGIIGYRGSSDCRILIVSHKPIMIAAAAPLCGHPLDLDQQPHGHELQLPQKYEGIPELELSGPGYDRIPSASSNGHRILTEDNSCRILASRLPSSATGTRLPTTWNERNQGRHARHFGVNTDWT